MMLLSTRTAKLPPTPSRSIRRGCDHRRHGLRRCTGRGAAKAERSGIVSPGVRHQSPVCDLESSSSFATEPTGIAIVMTTPARFVRSGDMVVFYIPTGLIGFDIGVGWSNVRPELLRLAKRGKK
jgi:hypothetical protein